MNADALRKLYPDFSEDELKVAGENLDAYLACAWEIWEEMQQRRAASLDDPEIPGQDSEERSIPHTN